MTTLVGIEPKPKEILKDAAPGLGLGGLFGVLHAVSPAITMNLPPQPFQMVGNVATAIGIAPAAEEFVFRGLIEGWIEEKTHSKYLAVFGTALSFALFHFSVYGGFILGNIMTFFTAFMFSIFFSVIKRYTNSLVGSTIAHMIINAIILSGKLLSVSSGIPQEF